MFFTQKHGTRSLALEIQYMMFLDLVCVNSYTYWCSKNHHLSLVDGSREAHESNDGAANDNPRLERDLING